MSSSSTSSTNDSSKSADRGDVESSNKKVSTSCEQKVESCNTDCVDDNTSSNSSSAIDTVSDSIERIGISNDDDDEKMSISDEKLFADPPPKEDCPICMQPMPFNPGVCGVTTVYMPCCGKTLCDGCSKAEDEEMKKGNIKLWCALCRMPLPKNDKEIMKRNKKRMSLGDAEAFYALGCSYQDGDWGLPQYYNKAMELWTNAAELGLITAHYNLGLVYYNGRGVDRNMKKAIKHYKLAAIGGDEAARHTLGYIEEGKGNMERAMKHYIISARSGYGESLKAVGEGYKAGHVTKDEYANTLRAHQVSIDEMKSKQRDIAAAAYVE